MIQINSRKISDILVKSINAIEILYQGLINNNLLENDGTASILRRVKVDYLDSVKKLEADVNMFMEDDSNKVSEIKKQKALFEDRLKALIEMRSTDEFLEKTDPEISLFWGGCASDREIYERIIKDNFFSAPAIQKIVENTLKEIAQIDEMLDLIKKKIEDDVPNSNSKISIDDEPLE